MLTPECGQEDSGLETLAEDDTVVSPLQRWSLAACLRAVAAAATCICPPESARVCSHMRAVDAFWQQSFAGLHWGALLCGAESIRACAQGPLEDLQEAKSGASRAKDDLTGDGVHLCFMNAPRQPVLPGGAMHADMSQHSCCGHQNVTARDMRHRDAPQGSLLPAPA